MSSSAIAFQSPAKLQTEMATVQTTSHLQQSLQKIVNRVARGAFLTEKEIEVLRALASGIRQNELAGELGLTKGAIAARVKKAMRSLDCETLNQAIAVATKWGYLDGPEQSLH